MQIPRVECVCIHVVCLESGAHTVTEPGSAPGTVALTMHNASCARSDVKCMLLIGAWAIPQVSLPIRRLNWDVHMWCISCKDTVEIGYLCDWVLLCRQMELCARVSTVCSILTSSILPQHGCFPAQWALAAIRVKVCWSCCVDLYSQGNTSGPSSWQPYEVDDDQGSGPHYSVSYTSLLGRSLCYYGTPSWTPRNPRTLFV